MNPQLPATTLLRKLIEEHWPSMEGLDALGAPIAQDYVHHRPAGDTDFEGF